MNIHWKGWCCSWNSNTLAIWCEELTHWKRPWFWERLKVGGEGDDRGWDGWMASPTWWTWVWASSRRWWRTGKPGVLQSMESQRVGHDWVNELNWLIWEHYPIIWNTPTRIWGASANILLGWLTLSGVEMAELLWSMVEEGVRRLREVSMLE